MNNPIKNFTKKEWILWIASLLIVIVSNLFSTDFDLLTLMAALIGVTSLIFAAKGNVWAQILMIMFSILYGIISYRFRYWGEMIPYLGMALPMAIWSTLTWIRHPSGGNGIVLIVLWTLASLENPAYIPVVVNFTIFFFNDMYGFISWKHREILLDL